MNSTEILEIPDKLKALRERQRELWKIISHEKNSICASLDGNLNEEQMKCITELEFEKDFPDVIDEYNENATEIDYLVSQFNAGSTAGLLSQYERDKEFTERLEKRKEPKQIDQSGEDK